MSREALAAITGNKERTLRIVALLAPNQLAYPSPVLIRAVAVLGGDLAELAARSARARGLC
jgi:hypothetical protein